MYETRTAHIPPPILGPWRRTTPLGIASSPWGSRGFSASLGFSFHLRSFFPSAWECPPPAHPAAPGWSGDMRICGRVSEVPRRDSRLISVDDLSIAIRARCMCVLCKSGGQIQLFQGRAGSIPRSLRALVARWDVERGVSSVRAEKQTTTTPTTHRCSSHWPLSIHPCGLGPPLRARFSR